MKKKISSILCSVIVSATPALANHTPESIKTDCRAITKVKIGGDKADARECRPTASALFAEVDGREYYYTLYCLIPAYSEEPKDSKGTCGTQGFLGRYHAERALVIFSRPSKSKEPLKVEFEKAETEIGALWYKAPEVTGAGSETLLHIPIGVDGSGNYNESEMYVRKNKSWSKIDTESWYDELVKKIPADTKILKGVWPDFKTMTATAYLYKDKDPNCCPTGGKANASLGLSNGRIVLKSVSLEPGESEN
ncbi:MAG TPA: hypothetical protein VFV50_17960 [Bdellovibrionales bacterium]|nr:hypothetical protein [Bdellovibrionales bacterium]